MSGDQQSHEFPTFDERNGKRSEKSITSALGYHYNFDQPSYRRPSFYPMRRDEEDSTKPLMPHVLSQLFNTYRQHQEQQRHRTIDNLIGSILKKHLLRESKLSRPSLVYNSDSSMETLTSQSFSNNTDEERDWNIALALSIDTTVDSLPLEDKMTLMSEYNFGTASEDEDIGEVFEVRPSLSFTEEDELPDLLRSSLNKGDVTLSILNINTSQFFLETYSAAFVIFSKLWEITYKFDCQIR